MWTTRDLISGQKPAAHDLFYNGNDDADGGTLRYKGSLVKATDWDNANGYFLTWGGESTAYENMFGILEEPQEADTDLNVKPSDGDTGMNRRKITPIASTTIVRAEYARNDPSGTDITLDGADGTAATTAIESGETFADTYTSMGAWLYFIDGANAGYLHYVETGVDGTTDLQYTLGTALHGTLDTADTFLRIEVANTRFLNFCAHEVVIAGAELVAARTVPVFGLWTLLTDVGIPLQTLDRNKHDGLKLVNPRFYHDFLLIGSTTLTNVFTNGLIYA